jgi:hypothetical protein
MLKMADRQAIENLVRSADEAATRRDDGGYAALYTEDGISEHLTRDISTAEEAGQIIARSNLLIVVPGLSAPFAHASVTQTVRRTEEGWRVARRLITQATSGTEA